MLSQTLIFGHRGYPKKFPENSLAGFRYAIQQQIDGLEFDVHLTKDQVPVVMHDEKIDRTSNGHGQISQLTLAELQQYHLSNGEKIPTLNEFLHVVAENPVQLNLELKTDQIHYPEIEQIVLKMVTQAPLVKPVIFSSFNLPTLKICQQLAPHEQYCWLTKHHVADPQKFIQQEHLAGLHLHHYQADIACQRIWTIDNSFVARRLLRHHVAGIITNDFEKIRQLRQTITAAS
ncbi:MAG: glycerophosphodiester phosphodiesterase family protein [Liquorilactobacillus ghanensis]|uniref:glycerophosphodiester phosphodiesterase n=1 Tax=Liquorilactobacillus TaxID=2767888 RepID=UPI0039E86A82